MLQLITINQQIKYIHHDNIVGCKYPKSRRFFWRINRQVEQLSEIIFKVIVKIALQCLMLPRSIASYSIYFFTDAGIESFQLPFTMW